MQKPTIGRIVIYRTTEEDKINFRSTYDNVVDQLPAVIVNVWNDTLVNLKVLTDGKTDLWKTSISQGEYEGQWSWPVVIFANPKNTYDPRIGNGSNPLLD